MQQSFLVYTFLVQEFNFILGIDKKITTGRAIAAFEATASNQISLRIGDIVQVHQMTPG